MLKNLKNKKKKGFTLVELVVVIAIIAILAAVLIPQITGYMKDAKRTDIIQQARQVVTVTESVNGKYASNTIPDNTAVSTLPTNTKAQDFIKAADIDKLGSATVGDCRKIIETDKYIVEMNGDDTFSGVTAIASN